MHPFLFKLRLFLCSITFLFYLNSSAQMWETINTPVTTNLILFDISFPAGQSDIGFTGGASSTWNAMGTILKTTNKGADWSIVFESQESGTGVTAIHFFDINNGIAGTQDGSLMRTEDGGESWTSNDFDTSTDQGEIRSFAFFGSKGAMLTAWGGVYISEDSGETWIAGTGSLPGAAHGIAFSDAENLFAPGDQQKIYGSSDGGNTWSQIFQGSSPWNINQGVDFLDENNGFIVGEEGNVYVTSDGGETWENQVVPNQGGLMRGALYADATTMYVTTTPGAVYKSTDTGETWTLDSPIDAQPSYYKIIMTEDGSLFVCGSGSTGGTILRKVSNSAISVNSIIINVACHGESNGKIELLVSGGTEPYEYDWSNGTNNPNLNEVPAGNYTCTITDNEGISIIVDELIITEPPPLSLSISATAESEMEANGSATADIGGGTPDYYFSWNTTPEQTTQTASNLSMGLYKVTVADLNGCQIVDSVVVDRITKLNIIDDINNIQLFPNPSTGFVNFSMQLDSDQDIIVQLYNSLGQEVFIKEIIIVKNIQEEFNWQSLPKGIYFLNIKSGNNKLTRKIILE